MNLLRPAVFAGGTQGLGAAIARRLVTSRLSRVQRPFKCVSKKFKASPAISLCTFARSTDGSSLQASGNSAFPSSSHVGIIHIQDHGPFVPLNIDVFQMPYSYGIYDCFAPIVLSKTCTWTNGHAAKYEACKDLVHLSLVAQSALAKMQISQYPYPLFWASPSFGSESIRHKEGFRLEVIRCLVEVPRSRPARSLIDTGGSGAGSSAGLVRNARRAASFRPLRRGKFPPARN